MEIYIAYLRKVFDWIGRWWWFMAGCALCLMVLVGVLVFVMPRDYEARAGIVLLRSRAEVSLGSNIQTLSQEDMSMTKTSQADATTTASSLAAASEAARNYRRLNSLADMVTNGTVAQEVADKLKGQLPDDQLNVSDLVQKVQGQVYIPPDAVAAGAAAASDTVLIIVTDSDPQRAALIANAWGESYEAYVNSIYGTSGNAPFGQIDIQVNDAESKYNVAEKNLEDFLYSQDKSKELARQITESEAIIDRLRQARQTSISAIIDKQAAIKQQLINAYLENDINNRLTLINKSQAAKRSILELYLDAEVANRIAAITRDRDIRRKLYDKSVEAEINSKIHVFEQQYGDMLSKLDSTYERKRSLENFLVVATQMRDQLRRGGDAAAASNALALLSLKGRFFSVSGGLPAFDKLQLNAQSVDELATPRSAAAQMADLDAMIAAVKSELATTEKSIKQQTDEILNGQGYQLMELLTPLYQAIQQQSGQQALASTTADSSGLDSALEAATAISSTLDSAMAISPTLGTMLAISATLESSAPVSTTLARTAPQDLNSFILQRYQDLFGVSSMASQAKEVSVNSPLFEEITTLYPNLFSKDVMTDLTQSVTEKTQLAEMANKAAEELLKMQGWEEMNLKTIEQKPLSQEIMNRETEVRGMQAELARLDQVRNDLIQKRDLAWRAFTTLLSKQLEVKIATAVEGTEVRFASPAVPPAKPASGRALPILAGLVLGLLLGGGAAFVMDFQGMDSREVKQTILDKTNAAWRRVRRVGPDNKTQTAPPDAALAAEAPPAVVAEAASVAVELAAAPETVEGPSVLVEEAAPAAVEFAAAPESAAEPPAAEETVPAAAEFAAAPEAVSEPPAASEESALAAGAAESATGEVEAPAAPEEETLPGKPAGDQPKRKRGLIGRLFGG